MIPLYGIVGDPIAHSLSPRMQNAAFEAAGLEALYLPFHVRSGDLTDFIQAARQWPLQGFNITVPHKQKMLELVDEVSEEARVIGAVNCVVREKEKLTGYNTDAPGYLEALTKGADWEPDGKTITVLGAGGAARAVVYALLSHQAEKIFLINRTLEKGEALAADFNKIFPGKITPLPWDNVNLETALSESHLLTNATSVGLKGNEFSDLPLAVLPKTSLVSDLVYGSEETSLVKGARAAGLTAHGGFDMLLHQGVVSFRLWTGVEPDVKVMRRAITETG